MNGKNNLPWIFFVARRFSSVDLNGSFAWTARLSSLGICFGVMTLIIVISVMNGFQGEFIDAIMEVSSYHARVTAADNDRDALKEFLKKHNGVLSASEFVESESFSFADGGKQAALLARGVDPDILNVDKGFARELKITRGAFDLSESGSIVLGHSLARSLGVRVGDEVKLYSINSSRPLLESLSSPKAFVVRGLFMTGYADINASYAFLSKSDAMDFFDSSSLVFGIKLKAQSLDAMFLRDLRAAFPSSQAESWRDYNKSFFNALRVEKNMLMLLVVLIFVVVAVNIYNSMRRMVYERRFELSALNALGGNVSSVKNIFVARGFLTGVRGAIPGLALGLFFCVNIKNVFKILSAAIFYSQSAFALFFAPRLLPSMRENPMFAVYGSIPAKMRAVEICSIVLFGIFSAVISSWAARCLRRRCR